MSTQQQHHQQQQQRRRQRQRQQPKPPSTIPPMSLHGPVSAINLYRQDPTTRSRTASPTSSKQRSVSSMTGLLPLVLPATSPSNTPESADMDGLFPEMLAKDLELSNSVFAARNMTSGSPSMAMFYEELGQEMRQEKPRKTSCPARILISPYQSGSVRIQALGAIEERQSMVSFTEQRRYSTEEPVSDEESIPSTEFSGGAEMPSVRLREQSIITAATSLTSWSSPGHSPKDLLSLEREDYTWYEMDTDDEDDIPMEEPTSAEQTVIALSPRPPTPPEAFDMPISKRRLHHRSNSRNTVESQRCHSIRSSDGPTIPPRRTSLSRGSSPQQPAYRPRTPSQDSRMSIESRHIRSTHQSLSHCFRGHVVNDNVILLKSDFEAADMEESLAFDEVLPAWPKPASVYIQETPPPSPLPTVESWLDSSNQGYPPQIPTNDLAKAVPLPPNIVETLRVSIACFPETMLLSSSLTIETIRSYSRKLRQPVNDIWKEDLADPAPQNPRRSLWKMVASRGRDSLSTRLHRSQFHEDGSLATTPGSEVATIPCPWASLKHVFGGCSDYICDALYAHIFAYNYISRVPRSQPAPHRISTASSDKSQSEDIPKKAASLLGLDTPQPSPTPNIGRLAKKLSTPFSAILGKEDTAQTTSAAAQDNATRNIEAGLLRCISRLVATARMMVEGGNGEEIMMNVEPQEVDMIFLRSLCEIVKINEEAA